MMEVGVLINKNDNPIHWHLPPGRSGGALPDSRTLWNQIWDNRHYILGFAHSHPGSGEPGPSWTDITTFAAIEAALGKRLDWWITSSDQMVVVKWIGPGKHEYACQRMRDSWWVAKLRRLSNEETSEIIFHDQ